MENKEQLHKPSSEQYKPDTTPPENSQGLEKKLTQERSKIDGEKSRPNESRSSEEAGIRKKIRLPSLRKNTNFIPPRPNDLTVKIEKVLEDGLSDSFSRLSPIAKEEFKLKGEQTAFKIQELIKSTHVKAKKIFQLILEWLKILPGVNRFFLEQEAKIKTDRILMIKEKNQK
jgi:hypothetical protein